MAQDLIINAQGLQTYYGASHILRGVNFSVARGETIGLMGRNGMGKTTLFKALIGVLPSRKGHVAVAGTSLDGMESHERVGSGLAYVPQGRMIFPMLTVLENIQTGLPKSAGGDVPDDIYSLFPVLFDMRKRRGGNLSGGQQQQLAIARALAAGPKLLLLDEPPEGIQPSIIKDIGRVIRRLADQGMNDGQKMAVGLVEQFYDFAAELADQYIVMERGEIIQRGRGADMEAEGVRALMSS